jgi:hypothetical protein
MQKSTLLLLSCLAFISATAQHSPPNANIPVFRMPVATFNEAYSNYKTKYIVLRKDTTGVMVNSKIYHENGKYYLSDKEKSDSDHRVYADETLKISFQDQRNGQVIEGVANDTCWLFKVISGKITLYSRYPPPDYLSNECLTAFQVNDGPIERLDIDKLRSALQDNKKAIAALDKNNLNKNNYIKAVEKFNKE